MNKMRQNVFKHDISKSLYFFCFALQTKICIANRAHEMMIICFVLQKKKPMKNLKFN